jgi:hypothetical protein
MNGTRQQKAHLSYRGPRVRDLSSHSGVAEDPCLLGCNAVYTGKERRFEGTQYLHIRGQAIRTIFLKKLDLNIKA